MPELTELTGVLADAPARVEEMIRRAGDDPKKADVPAAAHATVITSLLDHKRTGCKSPVLFLFNSFVLTSAQE